MIQFPIGLIEPDNVIIFIFNIHVEIEKYMFAHEQSICGSNNLL